ncbi:MAG: RdgB/HAM1 family non-canonical purine NTP pyrophosphatase [Bacteroidales bacterium]|nr:RdgB/HAM1 family non-canonical purine NTP pyrophosphatase [Bacteroidales bacterium]
MKRNMELIFATNNRHKLKEISALLGDNYTLLGLSDLDVSEKIPEDHETLEENASQKAWYIYNKFKRSCFADDTGLEVTALNGAPGVYSARYSRIGHPVFPEMEPAAGNIRKLLLEMEGISGRAAQFRTVIALVLNGTEYQFEGVVKGEIALSSSGNMGFGYDPVFRPEGYNETFALMDLSLKNRISHRARAINKLIEFLKGM